MVDQRVNTPRKLRWDVKKQKKRLHRPYITRIRRFFHRFRAMYQLDQDSRYILLGKSIRYLGGWHKHIHDRICLGECDRSGLD